jgi:hypothetical protein
MLTAATKNSPGRRRTAALLAGWVLLATAGCSDGAGPARQPAQRVHPREYAVSVCGRLQAWLDEAEDEVKRLSDQGTAVGDNPAARRRVFVATAAAIRQRTAAVLADLDTMGIPDVEKGATFAAKLRQAVVEADGILAGAEQVTKELPDDDRESFIYRGAELTQQIEKAFAHVRLAYDLLVRQYAATAMWEGFTRDVCRDYDDPRT